jgi:hypothetical protein
MIGWVVNVNEKEIGEEENSLRDMSIDGIII